MGSLQQQNFQYCSASQDIMKKLLLEPQNCTCPNEVHAYSAYVWYTSVSAKGLPLFVLQIYFCHSSTIFSHRLYNTSVQLAYERRLSSEISQLKWLLCLSHFFCNQFNTVCSSSDHSGQPHTKMPLIHISASGNFCRTNAVLIGKCIQAFFSGLSGTPPRSPKVISQPIL